MAATVAGEAKAGRRFRRFQAHDLRHKFAVDYLRRPDSAGIYRLKELLGHRSIKTTEIYLDFLDPETRRLAMRQSKAQRCRP